MVLSGETQWVSSSGKPREMAELSCTISSAGTCCLGWGKSLLMLLSLNSVPYLAETLSQTLIQMVIHKTDKTRDFFYQLSHQGSPWKRQNPSKAKSQGRRLTDTWTAPRHGNKPDQSHCSWGLCLQRGQDVARNVRRHWWWKGSELCSGKAIFNMVLLFSALLRGVGKCHPTCW